MFNLASPCLDSDISGSLFTGLFCFYFLAGLHPYCGLWASPVVALGLSSWGVHLNSCLCGHSCSRCDIRSQTRDRTPIPCIGSTESHSLDHREVPMFTGLFSIELWYRDGLRLCCVVFLFLAISVSGTPPLVPWEPLALAAGLLPEPALDFTSLGSSS